MVRSIIIPASIITWFLLFSSIAFAQHRFPVRPDFEDTRLGFGISAGLPTSYSFKSSINAHIQWQHDFSAYVSGLASIGYTSFTSHERMKYSSEAEAFNLIPLKVGFKIFPVEHIYISNEVGMAIRSGSRSSAAFLYAPGLGFEFYEGLDLGLSLENFKKYEMGNLALKISYSFNLTRYSGYSF
ncbi:MAG: hypothetical protein H7Y13_01015 [Sphingobacteriaceae bacterium]|nr:hypothetical protein [Sphingobacteriaceae bacterium]